MKATKMQHYLEGWGSASFCLNVIEDLNPIVFVWGYVKYCEIHCSCFTQLIIVITVAIGPGMIHFGWFSGVLGAGSCLFLAIESNKVGRKHIRLHHVTQSVTFRDKSPFCI